MEALVTKRLVAEAYVKRRKKATDANTYEYVVGARAALSRDKAAAANFRATVKQDVAAAVHVD